MAQVCTLMGIRHSPRSPYSSWTNGLVEVLNKNLGTNLFCCYKTHQKIGAYQVHMYVYAHNSQISLSLSLL